MTERELPEWPEYPHGLTDLGKALGDTPIAVYERARAAYWEARARLAVSALRMIESIDGNFDQEAIACQTLKAIGPMPKDGEK